MRALVCELPANLDPASSTWADFAGEIARQRAELVLLGELPFGRWRPMQDRYDETQAKSWVAQHESALDSLGGLAPVVISSRPVPAQGKIANQAFAMVDGSYVPLHQKHYFPEGECFFEQTWFETAERGFEAHDLAGIQTGVLLCTELMFNEWARRYGRLGAQIIAAPRTARVATKWRTAAAMAAIASGAFVLSSNRRGNDGGVEFGGASFIYAPGGELLAETTEANPIAVAELDLDLVPPAQQAWPCNVPELSERT